MTNKEQLMLSVLFIVIAMVYSVSAHVFMISTFQVYVYNDSYYNTVDMIEIYYPAAIMLMSGLSLIGDIVWRVYRATTFAHSIPNSNYISSKFPWL